MDELQSAAQRVQAALEQLGLDYRVVSLPTSTRTAVEAAATVGCTVGQIAKSLIFRALKSDAAILVIASGANQVNEERLADLVGEPIGRADAAFVRAQSGYAIGGVPPVGHIQPLRTFIDADLLQYATIWAAAGTPNSVFEHTPNDLVRMTDGVVVDIGR